MITYGCGLHKQQASISHIISTNIDIPVRRVIFYFHYAFVKFDVRAEVRTKNTSYKLQGTIR